MHSLDCNIPHLHVSLLILEPVLQLFIWQRKLWMFIGIIRKVVEVVLVTLHCAYITLPE